MRSPVVRSGNHRETFLTRLVQALNPLRYVPATAQADAALAEREALSYRNEALVRALGQIVYDWRPATNELIWDGDYPGVLGYSQEEMGTTTYSWTSRVHPDDLKRVFSEIERATRERFILDLEYRFRHRDGSYRWMHDRGVLSITPQGELERIIGVFTDVSERKRTEEALREREEILRLFVEHSPAAIAMFDTKMQYLAASRRWLADFGLGDQDLVGRSHYDVFPEIPQRWKQVHRRCLAGAVERHDEDSFVRSDGRIDWVRWEVRPWLRAGGTVGGIIIFTEVITQRKQTEQALHTAESRLSLALQAGRIGIWDWDMVTGKIVWSRGHEELWGMASGSFQGSYEEFEARLHPEDRDGLNRAVAQALTERRTYRHEYRVMRPDGSVRWMAGQGEPSFDDAGKPVRMIGVVMDITERKRYEDELRTKEAHIQALVGNVPGAVYRCGTAPGWTIEFISDAIEAISGYPAADFVNDAVRSYVSIIEPEDWPEVERIATDRLSTRQPYEVEYRIRHADGSVRWLYEKGQGSFAADGTLRWLDGIILDVTERKRVEATLREHGERLQLLTQQLVRVQEEEARRIGRELHDDLGQLLTTLKIKLQTLPRRKDGAEFGEKVADLAATVEHAIERVRTISADLRPTILDDLGLTAALRWMLDRQAQQAGLKETFVSRGVETRLPSELETTCFRVAQEALTNVVRHAKATHVRIDLRQEDDELRLQVSDDGVGFDPERTVSDISRGMNLGLLGMQERVALMNGRLAIRSAPGHGTEVNARFPLPSNAVSEVGR